MAAGRLHSEASTRTDCTFVGSAKLMASRCSHSDSANPKPLQQWHQPSRQSCAELLNCLTACALLAVCYAAQQAPPSPEAGGVYIPKQLLPLRVTHVQPSVHELPLPKALLCAH